MAPEVVLGRPYSEKVDVYSFGMIMWQMLSGETPFSSGCKVDTQAGALAAKGYRPHRPARASSELFAIITSCWQENPAARPSFKQLTPLVHKLLEARMQAADLQQRKVPIIAFVDVWRVLGRGRRLGGAFLF